MWHCPCGGEIIYFEVVLGRFRARYQLLFAAQTPIFRGLISWVTSTSNAVWRREVEPRRFGAGTGGFIQVPKWLLGQVELTCRVMFEVIG